jgi:TetR/AcrR family transcriptional regulator, transcriptional repressor for nem operon
MARQKEFNRDEVLHKAMEVFWTRGYERASIQDLVEHMGINRQSIYDTFGDKHAPFLQRWIVIARSRAEEYSRCSKDLDQ